MRWFRTTLEKNRLIILTFLALEMFHLVDGRAFVQAYQVHQEEEARLRKISVLLDVPLEDLRPDHRSFSDALLELFEGAEEPARAAGLERLQRELRNEEELLASNPYRTQIEAVKRGQAAHRIAGMVEDLMQLTTSVEGRFLPEASERALLRSLHHRLRDEVKLPPLPAALPASVQAKQDAMQTRLDRLVASVRPIVADTQDPQMQGTLGQKLQQLRLLQGADTKRSQRRPRFDEQPLPLRQVEKRARRVEVSDPEGGETAVRGSVSPGAAPTGRAMEKEGLAPEIIALADNLGNSPARIFSWVHDEIDFDPKWGAYKGPLGTLWAGAGTSWDQAWLLQSLLVAAGVDARLEWGEVEITAERLINLAGVEDPFRAGDLLTTAGIPIVLVTQGSQVIAARLSHVWVRAHLDYVPHRGVTPGAGDTWIRMDPSLKRFTYAPGIKVHEEVPFSLGDYLLSGTAQSPRRAYEDALWAYIRANNIECSTLEQLKPAGRVVTESFPFIPGTLRSKILRLDGEATDVPAAFLPRLRLEVRSPAAGVLLSWEATQPALFGQRLELTWQGATPDDQTTLDTLGGVFETPPYLVDLAPVLRLGGVEQAVGSPLGSAEAVEILVTTLSAGGVTDVFTHEGFAGEPGVFVTAFGQVPRQVLERFQAELENAEAAGDEAAIELATLQLLGTTYLLNLGRDVAEIAGWNWHRLLRLVSEGWVVQTGDVTHTVDGAPLSFTRGETFVDFPGFIVGLFHVEGQTDFVRPTLELAGGQGSFLEGQVFDQVLAGEGLAAVSALTRARREGQEVRRVDASNLDAVLAQVELGAGVESAVRLAVGQGKVAWVAERPVLVNQWRGSGYILEDPTTGAAGYLISGGFAGGVSTRDFLSEVLGVLGSEPWFEGSFLAEIFQLLGIEAPNTPSTTQSDPINMATGNLWFTVADLAVPARGIAAVFTRTYNSRSNHLGPLGHGWTFPYGERLEEQGDGSVIYRESDGTEHVFQSDGASGYIPPPGRHDILERGDSDWSLRLKNGITQGFALDGRLLSSTDRNGNILQLTYDGGGQLETVVDAAGRTVLQITTVDGKITAVTDLSGRSVTFSYTGDDLTGVVDASGEPWSYSYDADHNLIARVDPAGEIDTWSYDSLDRCVRHTDPLGHEELFSFPRTGHAAVVTDRRGFDTYLEFDERGRAVLEVDPLGNAVRATWDEDNNRVTATDARGGVTTQTFDERGNLLSVTDALEQTTTFTYDPRHDRIETITNAVGDTVRRAWDPSGNLLEQSQEMDGETVTVSYRYDSLGQLVGLTDAKGETSTWSWDAVKGTLEGFATPGVQETAITTDALGRILTVEEPDGLSLAASWNERHQLATADLPFGNTLTATYDRLGRRTGVETPRGRSETTYDPLGRALSITDPLGHTSFAEYDPAGNLSAETNAEGARTTYHHDAAGRLRTVVDPLGHTWSFGYCGELRATACDVTDPLGNVLRQEHDALGRVTRMVDPLGNDLEFEYDAAGRVIRQRNALDHLIRFEYDEAGRLSALIEANGSRTEYSYDAAGNLTNIRDAEMRDWPRTYDGRGRLKTEADPLGNVTTYVYDDLDNLTSKLTANGDTIRYEYNQRRQTALVLPGEEREEFSLNALGRVESVSNAEVSLSYEYDLLNQLTRVVNHTLGKEIRYRYDSSGRRTRQETPEGSIDYFYDARSQLVELHDSRTGRYVLEYDPLGRRSALHYPNGTTTSYLYDEASRLTALIVRDARGQVIDGQSYTYDDLGQRVGKTTLHAGLSETFSYDEVGRLVRWDKGAGAFEEYTYDLVGNRLQLTTESGTVTSTYDDADRLLTEVRVSNSGQTSTTSYSWDQNGNLIEASVDGVITSYLWDARNRLREVRAPGETSTYGYDPYRIRVRESDSSGTRRLLYSREDVVASYDPAGNLHNYYTHGVALDEPLAVDTSSGTRYLHQDAIGSVTSFSDGAGANAGRRAYRPFGAVEQASGLPQRYGFGGREQDATGLIYQRARYYAPEMGRFLGPDPLRVEGAPVDGTNLYTYVGNSPAMFTDPTGLYRVLASLWDFAVSLTLPAAAGSLATAGLSALLIFVGFGFIYSEVVRVGADNVVQDGLTTLTLWAGFSFGFIFGATYTILPVTFAQADPSQGLQSQWFSGGSLYATFAFGIAAVFSLTFLTWDVSDPAKATARPRSLSDLGGLGIDIGITISVKPLAWSVGF